MGSMASQGLPSKGVEDYLYLDWRRLESVTVVPNQPQRDYSRQCRLRSDSISPSSPSEFGSADGCKVSLLSSAPTAIQTEVAAQLEKLVEGAEHGIDLLRVALLSDALLVEVEPESKGHLKLSLEHDGKGAITAHSRGDPSGVEIDTDCGRPNRWKRQQNWLALPLTLIDIAESASLKQVVVSEGEAGRHVLRRQETNIRSNGHYAGFVLAASAALSREGHVLSLNGEGAHGELHGLYLAQAGAYTDIWARIEHLKPHTTSRSMFKGIVAERAESTFNGYVYVERDAQKTDSSLYNKNLLLSKRARANTRPQLEIYADDVKCAHGSTIGQLDDKQLFYLMTRGLPKAAARAMLIDAFGREVVEDCPVPQIREILDSAISTTITTMVEEI